MFLLLESKGKYKRCIPNFQKRNKEINPQMMMMMNNKMANRTKNNLMDSQIAAKILMNNRKIRVM